MILKITRSETIWPQVLSDNERVDYDLFINEKIKIFIYGHPFISKKKSWINAKQLGEVYFSESLDFVSEIEGVYSIIIHDILQSKYYIITDRYGIFNLFYYKDNNSIIIADDLQELSNSILNFSLNQYSIIEYLTFGFKLGKKTHVDGVLEFDSSSIYKINESLDISINKYWNFIPNSSDEKISLEEFREIFNSHIDIALNLSDNISLPLSAGIDTRMILSACLDNKSKFHCFTYGREGSQDIKIAKRIAKHFNIDHNIYLLTEETLNRFPILLKGKENLFNGLISTFMFLMHNLIAYENEYRIGDLMISGAGANEVWRSLLWNWSGLWEKYYFEKVDYYDGASKILLNIFLNNRDLNQLDVFKFYGEADVKTQLINSIKDELYKGEGEVPQDLITSFMFNNYLGNVASHVLKYLGKHTKIFPAYLNKILLKQIPFISLKDRKNGKNQKYVISKNNKYLSNLLINNGDIVTTTVMNSYKKFIWRSSKRLNTQLNQLLNGNIILEKIFPPFVKETDYTEWTRYYSKIFKNDLLNINNMKIGFLFFASKYENIFSEFINGNKIYTTFFSALLGLESWLKDFNNSGQID